MAGYEAHMESACHVLLGTSERMRALEMRVRRWGILLKLSLNDVLMRGLACCFELGMIFNYLRYG
jgi:hypothetical protein